MIVITGMHRSGTSLIAEILFRCGLDFGDAAGFFPADRWNPRGYFEQREVIDLNNRLICGFARTGGAPARQLGQLIYLTMPGPNRIMKAAAQQAHELARLGAQYQGKAVKDPRFSLTLRHWEQFARIESLVICLRGPRQTALSLYRRQSIPIFLGYRFWDYHMESLLESAAGRRVFLVDYDRLADPERFRDELRVIRAILPSNAPLDEIEDRYRAVFQRDLRHFTPGAGNDLPAHTRRIWDSFLSLRAKQVF